MIRCPRNQWTSGLRLTRPVQLALMLPLLSVACGPGPKPAALVAFEQLRAEPAVQRMKQAAPKIWKDSNNYYRLAFEAWEDSDDDESKEYTLLGTILYSTAREKADKAGIEAEMAEFKEQLVEGKKLRDDWADKRQSKEEAVSSLMGELQASNKLVNLEERRLKEQAALKGQLAKEGRAAEVRQRHSDLLARLKETEVIDAPRHAPGEYNRAKNLLNKAGYEIEDGESRKARETLEQAATSIATALDIARPKFETISKSEARAEEDQSLIAQAHGLGADDVRVEPRGLVIVINGVFKGRNVTVQPRKRLLLDKIGALMLEHTDYKVIIEGHTSNKGKDDANLTLSQAWANSAAGHFVSKGIPMGRLQALGLGESSPLEDNKSKAGRKKNKRIEVVFLFRRN